MKHTWHRNHCGKCGVTRHVPPGPRREFAANARGEEDRGRTESPYRYRLPDRGADLSARPSCAGKGESRHSRRAGRRAKVLAASRAGGRRLVSREEARRREAHRQQVADARMLAEAVALANASALTQDGGAPAILGASPDAGPSGAPDAS